MTRLTAILAAEVLGAFLLLQARIAPLTLGWKELKASSGLDGVIGPRMALVTAIGMALLLSLRQSVPELAAPARFADRNRLALLVVNSISFIAVVACALGYKDEHPAAHTALFLSALAGVVLTAALVAMASAGASGRRIFALVAYSAIGSLALVIVVRTAAFAIGSLQDLAWQSAAAVLRFAGETVEAVPGSRRIMVGAFAAEIAAGCSGVEGIALMLVCMSTYIIAFRRSLNFPAALLLLPVGILLIWCANLARLVLLLWIGAHFSPQIAVGGFHTQAGWILFNACMLAMMLASLRMRFFTREDSGFGKAPLSGLYLAPLLASAAISLAIGIFVEAFDWYYTLRVIFLLTILAFVVPRVKERLWRADLPGLAAGVAVWALWIALEHWRLGPELDTTAAKHLAAAPVPLVVAWLAARVVGAVVVAPLAEELAFRGFLARRIDAADFASKPYSSLSLKAIGVSSIVFGLAHGQIAGGVLAGVLYSLAARRTNSLGTAVFAHAVTNALLAVYVLVTGRWSLWG